jgi:single-strand DNA-binding protein
MNKVMLTGYLGADADVRQTSSGQVVANFRLATNERWKDKSGETHERAEWHRIALWGRAAEAIGKYLTKGRLVEVEGAIRTNKWEDKDRVTRYSVQIVAHRVGLLGSSPEAHTDVAGEAPTDDQLATAPPDDDLPF